MQILVRLRDWVLRPAQVSGRACCGPAWSSSVALCGNDCERQDVKTLLPQSFESRRASRQVSVQQWQNLSSLRRPFTTIRSRCPLQMCRCSADWTLLVRNGLGCETCLQAAAKHVAIVQLHRKLPRLSRHQIIMTSRHRNYEDISGERGKYSHGRFFQTRRTSIHFDTFRTMNKPRKFEGSPRQASITAGLS